MNSLTEQSPSNSLKALVGRLLEEHRVFSREVGRLSESIVEDPEVASLASIFVPLRESLIDHMLVEETDIFPEVSNRGLFDERISEIMQQHLDITAALDEMRFSLHRRDFQQLKRAFDELVRVMKIHFPAEEQEVFSLVL